MQTEPVSKRSGEPTKAAKSFLPWAAIAIAFAAGTFWFSFRSGDVASARRMDHESTEPLTLVGLPVRDGFRDPSSEVDLQVASIDALSLIHI